MANFTRMAIQESFIKLLNERPLKQISVIDIVNECGVSRNTFYYHFQDMPELVESIVRQNADRIINEHPRIESIADCVNAVINSWFSNRKAVLHIYKSLNRNIFETYHWKTCEYAVTSYLDTITENIKLSEEDRRILINYMQAVCFGIVMFWLDSNLDENILDDMQRICEIKQGDVQSLIEKCRIE